MIRLIRRMKRLNELQETQAVAECLPIYMLAKEADVASGRCECQASVPTRSVEGSIEQ